MSTSPETHASSSTINELDNKIIYWSHTISGMVVAAERDGVIVTVTRIPTPGRPLAMRETIPHTEGRAKR